MKIPPLNEFLNTAHPLPAVGSWQESVHLFDPRSAQAIRAALAAGRPLLVRGEPGTGKSQLARAAAKVLGREFLSHVITAHTEIQDLWFHFDAVSRLANAQIVETLGDVKAELAPEKYVNPGILWWAFDAQRAAEHETGVLDKSEPSHNIEPKKGVVLLLDEIDKADADLPNSLLETLDNGKFSIPWVNGEVGAKDKASKPLVVLTTNEDRQLPAAFIRRCLVLDVRLPTEQEQLRIYLLQRAVQHFPKQDKATKVAETVLADTLETQLRSCRLHVDVLDEAFAQLIKDRDLARSKGATPPGLAEYLDVLRVLDELEPDNTQAQLKLLNDISQYTFRKHPDIQSTEGEENDNLRQDTAEEID